MDKNVISNDTNDSSCAEDCSQTKQMNKSSEDTTKKGQNTNSKKGYSYLLVDFMKKRLDRSTIRMPVGWKSKANHIQKRIKTVYFLAKLYRNQILFIAIFFLMAYRAEIKNRHYYTPPVNMKIGEHYRNDSMKDMIHFNSKRNIVHRKHLGHVRRGILHHNASTYHNDTNYHAKNDTEIPSIIDIVLGDVNEPVLPGKDLPLFFHVPRSGGSTLKDIMRICFHMVEASDRGARTGDFEESSIQIIKAADGSSFLNTDTYTSSGIFHAKKHNLVDSGLADFISIRNPYAATSLFQMEPTAKKNKESNHKRGRMFVMMRHPMDRAISTFHYLGKAHWEEKHDPELLHISFELFSKQKRTEHNWMVRVLSNQMGQHDLTHEHLNVAKEVLRKKCVVGLLTEKEHSILRFEHYFGWKYPDQKARICQERLMHWDWSGKNPHPIIAENTVAWKYLYDKNKLDMELYEYAKQLFMEQSQLFQYHQDGHVTGLAYNEWRYSN